MVAQSNGVVIFVGAHAPSRAGDHAPAIADFLFRYPLAEWPLVSARAPKHAREASALPRHSLRLAKMAGSATYTRSISYHHL
jgi:hypothetical protein